MKGTLRKVKREAVKINLSPTCDGVSGRFVQVFAGSGDVIAVVDRCVSSRGYDVLACLTRFGVCFATQGYLSSFTYEA